MVIDYILLVLKDFDYYFTQNQATLLNFKDV